MTFKQIILVLTALLTAAVACAAADDPAGSAAQRVRFKKLYGDAQAGRYDERATSELRNYVLFPYLEAADLEYRLQQRDGSVDERVASFLERNDSLGPAPALRNRWLTELARRAEWQQFARHYRPSTDTALRCHQATARLRIGETSGLVEEGRTLWLSGKSQPDACDPIFEWLEEHGHLTQSLFDQRAKLAMEAGEFALAKSLTGRASEPVRKRVKQWAEFQADPIEQLEELADERQLIDNEALLLGANRAARRDSAGASFIMTEILKRYPLSREQRDRLLSFLGYQLALDRHADAMKWFSQLSASPVDAVEREWRVRAAIYEGDWGRAKAWISEMPDAQREEERWQYWLARSLEAAGGDDASSARNLYRELAAKRGYYPYLAADRVNSKYHVMHKATREQEGLRERLQAESALLRARELHALEFMPQARTEWKALTTNMTPDELEQAAVIAHEWGWHQQAIGTLATSGFWDDMHLRYPLPYRQEVLSAAKVQKLDPSWVYAIMRSESLYAADARSAVGALGLLQLMPATAQQVGRGIGIKARTQGEILEPGNNIKLGSAYLRQMLDRFGGHHAMASAAYNAGPHRVIAWRPERTLPADVWIENIPFNETRTYVQRVMEHAVAFDWRLERDFVRLSQRLPAVPAR